MDVEYARQEVERIRLMAGDYEAAHGAEDALYCRFVEVIAHDAPYPFNEIAKEIYKTREIDFARHCA